MLQTSRSHPIRRTESFGKDTRKKESISRGNTFRRIPRADGNGSAVACENTRFFVFQNSVGENRLERKITDILPSFLLLSNTFRETSPKNSRRIPRREKLPPEKVPPSRGKTPFLTPRQDGGKIMTPSAIRKGEFIPPDDQQPPPVVNREEMDWKIKIWSEEMRKRARKLQKDRAS